MIKPKAKGVGHSMAHLDFDQAPFLVIWETTQACDLACKHCRAEAQPNRHSDELTTQAAQPEQHSIAEGRRLVGGLDH